MGLPTTEWGRPSAKEIQAGTVRLPISEYFVSYQGEGARVGTPTVFLRVFGCNLQCEWCDTKYARTGKPFSNPTVRELMSILFELGISKNSVYDLCITGGEPLLYIPALESLLKYLRGTNYPLERVCIQTNGTVALPRESIISQTYLAVSPKPPEYRVRVNPSELKLIIPEDTDTAEFIDLIVELSVKYPNTPLYLQPVSVGGRVSARALRNAVNLIRMLDFRQKHSKIAVLPQVHRLLGWQ